MFGVMLGQSVTIMPMLTPPSLLHSVRKLSYTHCRISITSRTHLCLLMQPNESTSPNGCFVNKSICLADVWSVSIFRLRGLIGVQWANLMLKAVASVALSMMESSHFLDQYPLPGRSCPQVLEPGWGEDWTSASGVASGGCWCGRSGCYPDTRKVSWKENSQWINKN